MESTDPIFEPLKFRNLTVKNRLTRSSITGRIDNYDGSGTQARINWESKFARGGVGPAASRECKGRLTVSPAPIRQKSGKDVPNRSR
jgi:2,4-dienoyl-CoA reductase-like NADH-dependent reductase (Old Yellow Enzyme family)